MSRRSAAVLACVLAAASLAAPAQAQGMAAEDRHRVELIERVSRSVVHIKVEHEPPSVINTPIPQRRGKAGFDVERFFDTLKGKPKPEEGSGFVIDSGRGLILTAAHIVDDAKAITVTLPGGATVAGQVAGIDEDGGIALLRVAAQLPALNLSDRAPKAGETAIVVGWMIPLKSVMPVEGMVMGEAPGLDDSPMAPPFATYVALDAVIPNGGFGGSPVVDQSGKVIGMVSAIYGRTYGPGALTMMIPAATILEDVAQLAASGRVRRGAIGITVECPEGHCRVSTVEAGSAAETAGLRSGDSLIAVDGAKMSSVAQVQRAVGRKPIGSSLALTVYRDGRLQSLQAISSPKD
ncbi:MAG TPA: trypsin-like peptidase domain-containing protein [Sphingomicrobium sp.]|nr:trypsin-like peptidase domain-containing protein [Sphingomicrobium sp.]